MEAPTVPSSRARWIVFASVIAGTLLTTLDTSAVIVALPSISREFGIQVDRLQWVVLAFMLCTTSFTPIAGGLSDRLGRSRMYSLGFLLFFFGSLLASTAWNLPSLVAFRVLTAVGVGFIWSNGDALLATTFSRTERGRVFGLNGSVVGIGHISGPAVGGLIIGALGWRSIFWVTPLVALAGFIMARFVLPPDSPFRKDGSVDAWSALLFAGGVVSLLTGLSGAARTSLLSLRVGGLALLGLALLLAFARRQVRSPAPLMPPVIFRSPGVTLGFAAAMLAFCASYTNNFLTPYVAQNALGFGVRTTGLVMAAVPVGMLLMAPLSGYLSDRFGPRFFTVTGLMVQSGGFFLLSRAAEGWQPGAIVLPLVLIGMGGGLFSSPNASTIMSSVPPRVTGVVGGLLGSVRNFSFSVSTAVAAATFTMGSGGGQTPQAYLQGYHLATLTAAALALTAVLPALRAGLSVRRLQQGAADD